MGDYGKLLLLLLAIGLVLLAASGKGFALFQILSGRATIAAPDAPGQQDIPAPNPQTNPDQFT